MIRVLDASALLAYLNKESGHAIVKDALANAAETDRPLLMNTVNWGEVFYILIRAVGLKEAENTLQIIDTFPLEIVPATQELAMQAALYKSRGILSYADAFAAALARLKKAELLTSDHDFKAVERDIKIIWI